VKKLLRLLAADLAVEAEMVRRQWKAHDLAGLMPGSRRLEISIDTHGDQPGPQSRFSAARL